MLSWPTALLCILLWEIHMKNKHKISLVVGVDDVSSSTTARGQPTGLYGKQSMSRDCSLCRIPTVQTDRLLPTGEAAGAMCPTGTCWPYPDSQLSTTAFHTHTGTNIPGAKFTQCQQSTKPPSGYHPLPLKAWRIPLDWSKDQMKTCLAPSLFFSSPPCSSLSSPGLACPRQVVSFLWTLLQPYDLHGWKT